MKKIFYTLLGLSLLSVVQAQNVGIGTSTPDASAMLDITDTNRGILIPRVALNATNVAAPVTGPATSLLVYNTATAGTPPNNVTPGYYYWNGTQWVRLLSAESSDWKLDGNTNAALRYIGTNDNFDFPIRTNGTEKMRVTSGGNVGIGTTTPGVRLDVVGAGSSTIDLRVNGRIQTGDAAGNGGVWLSNASDGFVGNNGANIGFWTNGVNWNAFQIVKATGNIGIGTTTPAASARLEVNDANRGILIPRVSLVARNNNAPIGAGIVNSLLVYNTATSGTAPNNVTPGYYYWNATAGLWMRLYDGGNGSWDLGGNTLTGTLPASPNEFIGTINNADWVIRTNNTERARITSAGNVGIRTTTPTHRLHVAGTGRFDDALEIVRPTDGTNAAVFNMHNPTTGRYWHNVVRSGDNDKLQWHRWNGSGWLHLMTMDMNGNVGIATTAPNARLTIGNNVGAGFLDNYAEYQVMLFDGGTAGSSYGLGIKPAYMVFNSNGGYSFDYQGSSSRMVIDPNGNVGINTAGPDASAILDIQSTNKGVLLPRMNTAQRDAIPVSTARQGLLIYNTDNNCFEYFNTSANPLGLGGFWDNLCEHCEQVVIVSANQTGFNLNAYIGGATAKTYCVYVQTGVTLQAAGNGGGSGVAGNPGFNATTMPTGAKVILYNRGNILAGGGNGGQGGREGDGVCQGDNDGQAGGRGGDAIITNAQVPIKVYNYGTIRAGGGGGGGGRGGCCSAGGGGGGGAGTPAGSGGAGNSASCVRGFICGCSGVATSGAGAAGTALTGGVGAGGACSGGSGCPGTGSGCGSPGGTGGVPGVAGNNGSTVNGCCAGGCNAGAGGGAGLAIQGNASGSSLFNYGTVTGGVNP